MRTTVKPLADKLQLLEQAKQARQAAEDAFLKYEKELQTMTRSNSDFLREFKDAFSDVRELLANATNDYGDAIQAMQAVPGPDGKGLDFGKGALENMYANVQKASQKLTVGEQELKVLEATAAKMLTAVQSMGEIMSRYREEAKLKQTYEENIRRLVEQLTATQQSLNTYLSSLDKVNFDRTQTALSQAIKHATAILEAHAALTKSLETTANMDRIFTEAREAVAAEDDRNVHTIVSQTIREGMRAGGALTYTAQVVRAAVEGFIDVYKETDEKQKKRKYNAFQKKLSNLHTTNIKKFSATVEADKAHVAAARSAGVDTSFLNTILNDYKQASTDIEQRIRAAKLVTAPAPPSTP
jgi:hypothetical protein